MIAYPVLAKLFDENEDKKNLSLRNKDFIWLLFKLQDILYIDNQIYRDKFGLNL